MAGRRRKGNDKNDGYSESAFRRKVREMPRGAGRAIVEQAITLYVILTDRETPLWARALVITALAYWITPLDAVPDAVPMVGYLDDAVVLAVALAKLDGHITPGMRERVRRMMPGWAKKSTKERTTKDHEEEQQGQ